MTCLCWGIAIWDYIICDGMIRNNSRNKNLDCHITGYLHTNQGRIQTKIGITWGDMHFGRTGEWELWMEIQYFCLDQTWNWSAVIMCSVKGEWMLLCARWQASSAVWCNIFSDHFGYVSIRVSSPQTVKKRSWGNKPEKEHARSFSAIEGHLDTCYIHIHFNFNLETQK